MPQHSHGDVNLPAFLNAKNLKPFISNELLVTSSQIEFRRLRAGKAFGYSADLLPKVCEVFIDAERKQALVPAQAHIAERAHILLRGLATFQPAKASKSNRSGVARVRFWCRSLAGGNVANHLGEYGRIGVFAYA